MGRVIKRIFPEDFSVKIVTLLNKEVDCLLKNNAVYHGVVKSVSNNSIVLLNNVRNEKVISFSELLEISFV